MSRKLDYEEHKRKVIGRRDYVPPAINEIRKKKAHEKWLERVTRPDRVAKVKATKPKQASPELIEWLKEKGYLK